MTLTLPPPLRRSACTRQKPNAPPEQEVPAPETTKPAPLRKRKQIETEENDGGAPEPKRVKKRSANTAADARAIATTSKNIPQNETDLGVNAPSTEKQAVRQGSSWSNPSLSEQPPPPPPLADQDLSTQGLHWSDAPRSFGLIGTSGEFRRTAGLSSSLSSPPSPQTTSTKTQSPPAFPRALTGTSPHTSLSTVQDVPPAISAMQDLPPVALFALQDAPPAESLLAHSISEMQDLPPATLSAIQDVRTPAVQNVPVTQDLLPAAPSAMQEAPPAESPLARSISAMQDLPPAPIFVMQDVHTSVVQNDKHASPHVPPHASPSTMPDLVELPLPALPLADIVPSRRASPSTTQESQRPALPLRTVISAHTTSSKSLPRLNLRVRDKGTSVVNGVIGGDQNDRRYDERAERQTEQIFALHGGFGQNKQGVEVERQMAADLVFVAAHAVTPLLSTPSINVVTLGVFTVKNRAPMTRWRRGIWKISVWYGEGWIGESVLHL
ncbi:hypothetical protein B0H14DRAFT_2590050 [Mycena olivaceomarginata]|nr:hypothetical protein B0H14DRAFT_2590050 [Mycena olivaceomarginata]